MAISGFGRGKNGESLSSSPAATRSEAPGALTAFIDQGSHFEGKLSFKDTVRIDGSFQGEISSENTLIVGESGEVHASINSQAVVVSGSVVGDIAAGRQVVLHKTARLQGNVRTPSLVVEEGAVLNGSLTMESASAASASSSDKASSNGGQKPAAASNGSSNGSSNASSSQAGAQKA